MSDRNNRATEVGKILSIITNSHNTIQTMNTTDDLPTKNIDEIVSKEIENLVEDMLSQKDDYQRLEWDDFQDLFPIPDAGVIKREYELPIIPEHVHAAQEECARQFLHRVLIPRLTKSELIEIAEFKELLSGFKNKYRFQHPDDLYSDFSLTQALDRRLFMYTVLDITYSHKKGELLKRAHDFLGGMLDRYPEILYPI